MPRQRLTRSEFGRVTSRIDDFDRLRQQRRLDDRLRRIELGPGRGEVATCEQNAGKAHANDGGLEWNRRWPSFRGLERLLCRSQIAARFCDQAAHHVELRSQRVICRQERIERRDNVMQILFGGADGRTLFILTHHALYAVKT